MFDSWAGALSAADYETYVLPHSSTVLSAVADLGVPRIHFGVGTGELLALMGAAGADVVGVDWRVPLDEAARRVPGKALQGNLDPAILCAPWPVVEREVRRVVAEGRAASGTCSTSVTGCHLRPTPTCWPEWSRPCTRVGPDRSPPCHPDPGSVVVVVVDRSGGV